MIRDFVLNPAFNTTRASHVVLSVTDLEASRSFYCDVVGLIESDRDNETVYLRGLEESSHHSLVLKKGRSASCHRIGFRTLTDDDLEKAARYFEKIQVACSWADVPYQGKTLQFKDPVGMPVELCASMTLVPRFQHKYESYRGGAPQRLDHYQVASHDIRAQYHFYNELGFRPTEYVEAKGSLWGVWLQRKGNTHDLVFTNGRGPRLHHFAYTIRDAHDAIHLLDVAGSMGFGGSVERGPGRHGMGGGAMFLYLRDPDGHRVEFFNTHYQAIDIEPPVRWSLDDPKRTDLWGMPALEKWFYEATAFEGCAVNAPLLDVAPRTLESVIAENSRKPAA